MANRKVHVQVKLKNGGVLILCGKRITEGMGGIMSPKMFDEVEHNEQCQFCRTELAVIRKRKSVNKAK